MRNGEIGPVFGRHSRTMACLFLAFAACNEAAGGEEATTGASESATTDSGEGDPSTSTDGDSGDGDGDSATSDNDTSSSGDGDGSSGGDGDGDLLSLFPLAVGNTWNYSVSLPDQCQGQSDAVHEVLALADLKGLPTYTYDNGCQSMDTSQSYLRRENLDRTLAFVSGADMWIVALEEPVEEGMMWSDPVIPNLSFAWTYLGQVTVPAGTFDDCWRRTGTTQVDYCRGVGPVRHWATADTMLAELSSYELVGD